MGLWCCVMEKAVFSSDPTWEVTPVISLPQEANYKLHHGRIEENAGRGRVNSCRTENSS